MAEIEVCLTLRDGSEQRIERPLHFVSGKPAVTYKGNKWPIDSKGRLDLRTAKRFLRPSGRAAPLSARRRCSKSSSRSRRRDSPIRTLLVMIRPQKRQSRHRGPARRRTTSTLNRKTLLRPPRRLGCSSTPGPGPEKPRSHAHECHAEQLAAEMRRASNAGRRKVDLARFAFGIVDEFRDRSGRERGIYLHHKGYEGYACHWCDVADVVELDIRIQILIISVSTGAQEKRITRPAGRGQPSPRRSCR
jgi:hypothetical protein